MYSLGAILNKQPSAIASGIRAILWLLVLLGAINLADEALAGIALVVELLLGLFVYHSVTPIASPTLPSGTEVAIEGSSDSVIVQPSPPGPIAVEGAVEDGDDYDGQGAV